LASAGESSVAQNGSGHTGDVRIWDTFTGKEVQSLKKHTRRVASIAFSPDGKLLASGGLDNTVSIWDINTGEAIFTLEGHDLDVRSLSFSPDGQSIASASQIDDTGQSYPNSGVVRVWDVRTGHESLVIKGKTGPVWSIAYSPDGKRIVTGSSGPDAVKLWDSSTAQRLLTLRVSGYSVRSVAYSPDGSSVAATDGDEIRVFDVSDIGATSEP
jgi:WD40 repeat protein